MSKHAQSRIYALYGPGDPRVRWIGWKANGGEGWRLTWRFREELSGPLAGWFRELASKGQEPIERVLLGLSAAVSRALAPKLLSMLRKAHAVDTAFLRPPGPPGKRKVLRIDSEGRIERYASISDASRATGIDVKNLWWFCETGEDYEGYRYLAD